MVLLLLVRCGPATSHVEGDQATYEAVAPEYLRYVEADAALDSQQKERRKRTVDPWGMRIETAEGK